MQIAKGDGFPSKVLFNGEECSIPTQFPLQTANQQNVYLVQEILVLVLAFTMNHILYQDASVNNSLISFTMNQKLLCGYGVTCGINDMDILMLQHADFFNFKFFYKRKEIHPSLLHPNQKKKSNILTKTPNHIPWTIFICNMFKPYFLFLFLTWQLYFLNS